MSIYKWGEKQAEEYQRRLLSTFHTMVIHPDLGRKVEIRPQIQQFDVIPYVIFYRKFSYGIRIARILDKKRAMEKHL